MAFLPATKLVTNTVMSDNEMDTTPAPAKEKGVPSKSDRPTQKQGFKGGARGGKRQSPTVRNRNKQKNEEYRGKKADAANAARTQALKDKLFFGFREQSAAMASMQVMTVDKNVIFPVTTRAVGFMSQFMFCKFARLQVKIPLGCSVYALYRVVLIQFEYKLMQALAHQSSRSVDHGKFQDLFLTGEEIRKIGQMGANFSCFVNLISAVGVFKCYGTQYVPRLPSSEYSMTVPIPEPTNVIFSNLEKCVQLLSLQSTPRPWRQRFYDANPLPGAVWGGQPTHGSRRRRDDDEGGDFPLLMNPHDFYPEGYNHHGLAADIACVQDLLEVVGRKYPKYVSEVSIDYDAPGSPTQLVSSGTGDIRCKDLPLLPGGEGLNFAIPAPVTGSERASWSPERLSEGEYYMGILQALGETWPLVAGGVSDIYSLRSRQVAKQECESDYVTALSNFLG